MRVCPNCGQDAASDSDRFCPNCGAVLPPVPAGAERPAYQQASPLPQPTPTAPAPAPNAYGAPSYTRGGTSGGNLPVAGAQAQRNQTAGTNTWMNMVRSLVSLDPRGLAILAVVVLVVLVALVLAFKIVAWFLGLWWLWLLIIAAIAYTGHRRGRGRRLP